MLSQLFTAVRVMLVMTLLTGVAYPLLTTGAARVLFASAAEGSLVRDDKGAIVGSSLIGQRFTKAAYFQGRPSAAEYDAAASSGSNLGPRSKKLRDRIAADLARWQKENPDTEVPGDLLTASGSGLDPHLSPDAARFQIARIATARAVAPDRVEPIVAAHIESRDLGFLGEPRVNVLALNLALDAQFGRPGR